MPDSEQILNAIVERIEAIARPERVILFGSRARGKAAHTRLCGLPRLRHGAFPPR